MAFGSSTFMVADAVFEPTCRVTVTAAARSGAVQVNEVPLPVTGDPPLAVHVPAALPVKTTLSPTPTWSRDFGDPSGAWKSVWCVMVGSGSLGFGFGLRSLKSR